MSEPRRENDTDREQAEKATPDTTGGAMPASEPAPVVAAKNLKDKLTGGDEKS